MTVSIVAGPRSVWNRRPLAPRLPARPAEPVVLALATAEDREQIYRLRHGVYAHELGQHGVRPAARLIDELDARNIYLVARIETEVVASRQREALRAITPLWVVSLPAQVVAVRALAGTGVPCDAHRGNSQVARASRFSVVRGAGEEKKR